MHESHSENIHPGRRARRSGRRAFDLRADQAKPLLRQRRHHLPDRPRRRRARLPRQDRRRRVRPRPTCGCSLSISAEIADFVLVDDFSGDEPAPCRSSTPIRTVALDADAAQARRHRRSFGRRRRRPTTRSMSIRCGSRSRTPRRSSPRCGRPTSGAKRPARSAKHFRVVSTASTMPRLRSADAAKGESQGFPGPKSPRTH